MVEDSRISELSSSCLQSGVELEASVTKPFDSQTMVRAFSEENAVRAAVDFSEVKSSSSSVSSGIGEESGIKSRLI